MIHPFNGHVRLRCDECFTSDEFANKAQAEQWAESHGWETIERGGGDVVPFADHICGLCVAQKMWRRVAA